MFIVLFKKKLRPYFFTCHLKTWFKVERDDLETKILEHGIDEPSYSTNNFENRNFDDGSTTKITCDCDDCDDKENILREQNYTITSLKQHNTVQVDTKYYYVSTYRGSSHRRISQ